MDNENMRKRNYDGKHIAGGRTGKTGGESVKTPAFLAVMLWVFALAFAASAVMAASEYIRGEREQAKFDSLADKMAQSGAAESNGGYGGVYGENSDMAGWITVENTNINYPVMYTPYDPEYYLYRGFDKTESKSGSLFIGEGGDIDSGCFIVYGHNMKNGTMFGTLDYYEDENFYKENPLITVTTLGQIRTYEVFAAVKTRVLYNDEDGFRYYYQSGRLTEDSFYRLTGWLTENSLYKTESAPEYGSQIVMLSTCSYDTDNGRFVVAAALKDVKNK